MQRELSIEREIMGYLLQHPEAKDTAEGIMLWWLPRSYSTVPIRDLKEALERMVANGRLAASMHAGTRVYGLSRARHDATPKGREN